MKSSIMSRFHALKFTTLTLLVFSALMVPHRSFSAVIAGPITNTANGHLYFLLSQSNWTTAESAASALGGHLVAINDQAENSWVRETFGSYRGVTWFLWIGLYDDGAGWHWTDGEALTYTNWQARQPS